MEKDPKDSMLRVMTKCPTTGKDVFTGARVADDKAFQAFKSAGFKNCRECGGTHQWDHSNAWLEPPF